MISGACGSATGRRPLPVRPGWTARQGWTAWSRPPRVYLCRLL